MLSFSLCQPSSDKASEETDVPSEKESTSDPSSVATTKRGSSESGPVGAKRSLDLNDVPDEMEDENKKKKRRDSDAGKDATRNAANTARPSSGEDETRHLRYYAQSDLRTQISICDRK